MTKNGIAVEVEFQDPIVTIHLPLKDANAVRIALGKDTDKGTFNVYDVLNDELDARGYNRESFDGNFVEDEEDDADEYEDSSVEDSDDDDDAEDDAAYEEGCR